MKTFDIWVRQEVYRGYRIQAENKEEAIEKFYDYDNYDEIFYDEDWSDSEINEIDEINEVTD
jgi:hypothetical protein